MNTAAQTKPTVDMDQMVAGVPWRAGIVVVKTIKLLLFQGITYNLLKNSIDKNKLFPTFNNQADHHSVLVFFCIHIADI